MNNNYRFSLVSTIHRIWNELTMEENIQGVDLDTLASLLSEKNTFINKKNWIAKIQIASADRLLDQWLNDNLKSMFGLPRLDMSQADKGDRDWFCFVCHKPGEVYKCQKCTKSFHRTCHQMDKSQLTTATMNIVCDHCALIDSAVRTARNANVKKLNEMIIFIIQGILDKKFDVLNNASSWTMTLFGSEKEAWRFQYIIFSPIDVNVMHKKALLEQYKSMDEFRQDCMTLVQFVAVYFGPHVIVPPSIFVEFMNKVQEDSYKIELAIG